MTPLRALLVLVFAASASASHARSDDAVDAACVADHGQALDLRKAGKLGAARDKLRECAADRCPDVLRAECTTLFEDVERDIPTVVVSLADTAGARLFIDGKLRSEPLSAAAIPLDPGDHELRVEQHGRSAIQKVRLLQGEKNVRVGFAPEPKPKAAKKRKRTEERTGALDSTGSHDNTPLVVGLGATSVVALGAFGYFAITGYGQEKDLDDCAPNCTNAAYDDMYRNYRYADIALAVSAVAAGGALYFALSSKSSRHGVAIRARQISLHASF